MSRKCLHISEKRAKERKRNQLSEHLSTRMIADAFSFIRGSANLVYKNGFSFKNNLSGGDQLKET